MQYILVAGIGRMGKGIALAVAYAGFPVSLVDTEKRSPEDFAELGAASREELADELRFLVETGLLSEEQASAVARRIRILERSRGPECIADADFVFEAVAETVRVKRSVYGWLDAHLRADAIVSSTTSTMSANDLARFITGPERFVNAHWLNPAHLMPLVEVSPGDQTSRQALTAMESLLNGIGKVPVVCRPSPGFIVSRIQAAALNEAARIVEEEVASAAEVDRAVKVGFGIRYATLGLLEFIDWGGGDILYHATEYLGRTVDRGRFSVPAIVRRNMEEHRNGLRDGIGFYDWRNVDIDEYRQQRMKEFVELLKHRKLMPEPDSGARSQS